MGRDLTGTPDLLDEIKELRQRIANLERSQRSANTSVDRGSITVNNGAIVAKHPNGVELFRAGTGETVLPFEVNPTQGYVTRVKRASGQVLLETFSSAGGAEAKLQVNDRNGNEILGDDWLIGRGLSRPFVPWRFYPTSEWATPPQIVTSATYVSVFTITGNIQHPAIYVNLRIVADIGTAGNVRLQDPFFSSTMWSDTIAAGFNGNKESTSNINGLRNYGDNCALEVQVQRTAGAGNIRIGVELLYGRSATSL